MAKVDMETYRRMYLNEVEQRIMSHKDDVPNFTPHNLSEALRAELNRADEETWEFDVPDDKEQALKEAESRMIETMKHNKDLGVGKSW
jgi:hypothetical protein